MINIERVIVRARCVITINDDTAGFYDAQGGATDVIMSEMSIKHSTIIEHKEWSDDDTFTYRIRPYSKHRAFFRLGQVNRW